MSYSTLAEFKASIGIQDNSDDQALQSVLDATDDLIDNFCDLPTGFDVSASQVRYYTAVDPFYINTDDIVTVTALQTDDNGDGTYETTWTVNTDYILAPRNAALDARPYTEIDTAIQVTKTFPLTYLGVKVTGTFGFPAVPSAVKQAALIQAGAVWSSRTAPFGVIGSQDLGGILRLSRALHPEAQVLLEPYRRRLGLAY